MVLTMIFITLAVGILTFAVITQPLYDVSASAKKTEGLSSTEELSPLEDRSSAESLLAVHQKYTIWLQDLEIELAAGKIDQQDFMRQRDILQQEDKKLLDQLSESDSSNVNENGQQVEKLISSRRMQRVERSAGFCVKCGSPLQRSDQFCPNCGLKLK